MRLLPRVFFLWFRFLRCWDIVLRFPVCFFYPLSVRFFSGVFHLYPFGFWLLSFPTASFLVLFVDPARNGACRRPASGPGLPCFVAVFFFSVCGVIMVFAGLFDVVGCLALRSRALLVLSAVGADCGCCCFSPLVCVAIISSCSCSGVSFFCSFFCCFCLSPLILSCGFACFVSRYRYVYCLRCSLSSGTFPKIICIRPIHFSPGVSSRCSWWRIAMFLFPSCGASSMCISNLFCALRSFLQ